MINTARLHSDLSRLSRETAMMSATIETLVFAGAKEVATIDAYEAVRDSRTE